MRVLGSALGLWLALFALVRLRAGERPAAPVLASAARPFAWTSHNSVKLFKRTHASTHPQLDGWFLSHYVGVEQTAAEFWMNDTQYSSKLSSGSAAGGGVKFSTACELAGVACCAERASMTTLGTFTFHEFRSWLTPTGNASVEAWVAHWSGLRNFETSEAHVWDAYMHLATHFFTPNLSSHARRLVSEGIPFLGRTYSNPVDGAAFYVIAVTNPYSGHAFFVHASSVDASLARTAFARPLAGDVDVCAGAVEVSWSSARLESWWAGLNGSAANAQTGLPDVLAIGVNQVTPDAAQTLRDLASAAGLGILPWNFTASDDGNCVALSATLPTGRLVVPGDGPVADTDAAAVLRFVESSARDGGRPVAEYAATADGNVAAYMGANTGWARFLDYHVGLNVPGALDDFKPALDRRDAHYHAHVVPQSGTPDDGSIFAKGAAGLSVELHGVFNYTAFDPEPLGALNFCAADSACARGLGLCSGDVLHQDYPGFRVYAAASASCDGAPGDCGHYAVAGADVRKK